MKQRIFLLTLLFLLILTRTNDISAKETKLNEDMFTNVENTLKDKEIDLSYTQLVKQLIHGFLKRNYNVSAIDGSEEICKEASKYIGIKVKQMLFEELNDQNIYDGIWACASILHLSKNDLFRVFHKMNQALKENGIIYTSFKYGEFEGERNGRYFTDFTEDSSKEFILQIPQLQIKEIWTTGDVREGRGDERWLNILICKGKIS